MKSFRYLCLISGLILIASQVQAVEICGELKQGELVIGKATRGDSVYINGDKIASDEHGMFLTAFGRDDKEDQILSIVTPNNIRGDFALPITANKWTIQNIKGIPPRKVTPSDADLAAIDKENSLLKKALKTQNEETFWRNGFIRPVDGRISGEFGGQRIMNGIPKSPHRGMDIAAKEGTPVKAAADGTVVLAYPDLFYSGNMIVIDHGFGLQTIYAHLKEMKVKFGDKVKQGDIIGLVGKTGRATGAHLHFGSSLRNVRFNPQSLLDMNNNLQKCFTL